MNEDVSFLEMVINIIKSLFDFFKDLFDKISSGTNEAETAAQE